MESCETRLAFLDVTSISFRFHAPKALPPEEISETVRCNIYMHEQFQIYNSTWFK